MVDLVSNRISGIAQTAPQTGVQPTVGGHSWKAMLSSFVRRASDTLSSGVQSLKALVTRNVTAQPAPTQPRISQDGDPGISAPTPQKTRDALVARATVDMLPPALRNSDEFKRAVENIRTLVPEAGAGLGQAMDQLGKLLLEPRSGMGPALSQLALSDGRDFLSSLLGKPLDGLPPQSREALLAGFDRIASALPDREVDENHLTIGGQLYKREKTLGEGNFGAVHLYVAVGPVNEHTPEKLAVKISKGNEFHVNLGPDESMRRNMVEGPLSEARAMVNATGTGAGLGSDNMLKLHGVVHGLREPSNDDIANGVTRPYGVVMIATEFAGGGAGIDVAASLNTLLGSQQITPAEHRAAMLTLLRDMLQAGQRQDEAKGMIHFDFRPDNMLVSSDGTLKVGDRGLNVTMEETERRGTGIAQPPSEESFAIPEGMKMPVKWMAPEIFRDNASASGKSDVWSSGISFYEMLHTQDSSQHPHPLGFDSMTNRQAIDLLQSGQPLQPFQGEPVNGWYTGPNGRLTEESLGNLIRAMLDPDPSTRPSFGELLNDPLFGEPGVGSDEIRALIGGAKALLQPAQPNPPAQAPDPAQGQAEDDDGLYNNAGPPPFYTSRDTTRQDTTVQQEFYNLEDTDQERRGSEQIVMNQNSHARHDEAPEDPYNA